MADPEQPPENVKETELDTYEDHTQMVEESLGQQNRYLSEDNSQIKGDFKALSTTGFSEPSALELPEEVEDEVEESISIEESYSEVPAIIIDREMYYNLYDALSNELQLEKAQNNFLQKKMAEYYRKRRMEHVLKECPLQLETERKYDLQLDALQELNEICAREKERMHEELIELKAKRDGKSQSVKTLFQKLQQMEQKVGNDLLTNDSGQGNVEKIVDRHLKRQRSQMADLIKMRLNFMKIKNSVNDKQEALNALDNLGPNLHLIDYEQLKVDNRNNNDKLEEKENELIKLRRKCQNAMQILAHRREKASALDADIQKLNLQHATVQVEFEDAREQLNFVKRERDQLRNRIIKMKDEAGLLSKPTLLRDMKDSLEDVNAMTEKLESYKNEYNKISKQVTTVRKNLAIMQARHSDLE